MKPLQIKKAYDSIGLETFPVPFGQKSPPPKGWQTRPTDELWDGVEQDFNIAIRLGKVTDFESDDLISDSIIDQKLSDLGVHDVPICHSKRGKHRFVRISGAPEKITYTTWKPDIGKGEARIKDCYSVVPTSEVNHFTYFWEPNWDVKFQNLPVIKWTDIEILTNHVNKFASHTLMPRYFRFKPANWAMTTLELLQNAKKGAKISLGEKSWPSRSEAEQAVIYSLDGAGLEFNEILTLFERYKPGHFVEQGGNKLEYLSRSYEVCFNFGLRGQMVSLYDSISGHKQSDSILKILLAIGHQLEQTSVYVSYEKLALILGVNSKTGPHKACKKLQLEGKIRIIPGQPYIGGIATIFDISPLLVH